jgi:hypothetical protein
MPTKNRSWLALLAYCLIAGLAASLAFATLFAGATLAFGLGQSSQASGELPAPKIFSGVITDSFCGARHATNTSKDPAECTRACVRRGAKYVLVNGDTTYILAGNRALLDKLAGERVQVRGTLAGDTLKASSITAETEVRRRQPRRRPSTQLDAQR